MFVIVALSVVGNKKLVTARLVIVAESKVAVLPVNTEFAIFVIVALSPNAESKFMNSVLTCLISELSAFKLLTVAESSVACENVICVVDRLVIVALSKNALSAFINPVDNCLTCPESKVNLSMFAESTSKSPTPILLKDALSPEDITAFVIAILPMVAESTSKFVPVIAFAVKVEFARLVIVAESVNCWSAFIVPVAIVLIVALSAVRLFPIATLPEKTALSADTSS